VTDVSTEILARVRAFVASNFYLPDPAALADDASLLDHGVIDSTGVLELVTFVEDTFAIAVADDDMVPANFDSLAAIAAFVARKQAQAGA
jgi:acyl carrier protein